MEQNPHSTDGTATGGPVKTRSAYMENQRSIPLQLPIALTFGDRPALILQQIRYWMRIHEESESQLPEDQRVHFKEGRWWVYNSYEEWLAASFGFWSQKTLERHIRALEKAGVLISRMFNEHKGDRTKWYTIDFDVLDRLVEECVGTPQTDPSEQNGPMGASEQNDSMVERDHAVKMTRSLHKSTEQESTGKGANAPLSNAHALDAGAETDDEPDKQAEDRSEEDSEPPPKPKRKRSEAQLLNDAFIAVIAQRAFAAEPDEHLDDETFKRVGKIIAALRKKWPAITPHHVELVYDWYAESKGLSPPRDVVKVIAMFNEFRQVAEARQQARQPIPDIDPETGRVLRVGVHTVLPEEDIELPMIQHDEHGNPLPRDQWHY